ncbi:hypothetical protein [Luteipulveratus mongoliensis]|uniref:Uncharacterized protein n=1 Tax=Luteipulveratus mongoliensis TaxID=571913 RepID=A0A0K1JEW9_9MICO|nr:hypothetical protein [Luteipulveratus mongoliensis]AKU15244.1 hypothetical protein VV02_04175 [Luteipulveratus mongoliensis]
MATLAMLPVIAITLSMIFGSLAAIGRMATPERERIPLRRWRLRELRSNASIGKREWVTALEVAYGRPSGPKGSSGGVAP